MTSVGSGPWNHNIHYHRLILRAVPAGSQRCLDVGCGDGLLARKLRQLVPHVSVIDQDGPIIEAARLNDRGLGITYLHGDFLKHEFGNESFDFITCVAVLHHLDAVAGLQRMRDLLKPGGTLVVIGCAEMTLPADLPYELAGAIMHRVLLLRRTWAESGAPTLWPPPETYAGMRRVARHLLPGSRFRRRALWRYSLTWIKPVATHSGNQPLGVQP
jgi:SAM-dependent methyltransferase